MNFKLNIRPFELGLLIGFLVLGIVALILLSSFEPAPDPTSTQATAIGSVRIWGTMPQGVVDAALSASLEDYPGLENVRYTQFSPEEFDLSLVTALADDNGPDLVVLSHEKLAETRRRIQPFAPGTFAERDLRNVYLDGTEIFSLSDGVYAYPLAIDPMVIYWNRDILANEGFLEPPATWESLVNQYFPQMVARDFDRTVRRTVVPMGEYRNIRNGFGIISSLLLQAGSAGVIETRPYVYQVQLQRAREPDDSGNPIVEVADFYTRFAQPDNSLYNWNRAFESDRIQFIGEDSVFYFGYASEARTIRRLNPNLNFDIAEMPQGANATVRRTYGRFYGVSLMRNTQNPGGSLAVMQILASAENIKRIADEAGMAPATRSGIAGGSDDFFGRVAYQSAPITYAWLNPDIEGSDEAFSTMTADINENRESVGRAASDLVARLTNLY